MYYDDLNKIIQYIEEHLEEPIEIKQLSKLIGMNDFILQRIFVFLTDMTLTEYIKKRRLSRAFEELMIHNKKIIDIALQYQYNSPEAFTRSFKSTFGITPSKCRLEKKEYKLFPMYHFQKEHATVVDFKYKIQDIQEILLYCFHIVSDDKDNLLYEIRKLYTKLKQDGIHQLLNEQGMYGIELLDDQLYHYYVGSTEKNNDLEKYIIPSGKYAVFELNSRKQEDIVTLEKSIYSQWFPSTSFSIGLYPNFEQYEQDKCYIYISIQ